MAFTFCTSGAIVIAAGANVNSTGSTSAAILQQFSNDAEGKICMATRYDWINFYSTAASYAKLVLADAASSLAAIKLMKYDYAGYTNNAEYTSMTNVLYDSYYNAIELLKNYKRPTDEA